MSGPTLFPSLEKKRRKKHRRPGYLNGPAHRRSLSRTISLLKLVIYQRFFKLRTFIFMEIAYLSLLTLLILELQIIIKIFV